MLVKPLSGRKVSDFVYLFEKVNLVGDNLFFPNPLIFDGYQVINPSQEFVASLKVDSVQNFEPPLFNPRQTHSSPVFYFIYNFDNYFHFLYDCLPYLLEYRELKKSIPELKLLVNYPNPSKKGFYRFNIELLELLGITKSDLLFISSDTLYQELYVSETLTYRDTPDPRVFDIYDELVNKVKQLKPNFNSPEKFYVSRRTWLSGDTSNIGTNYTTRRQLVNETELVTYLISKGYTEVFTENLSTVDKILTFNQAKSFIGAVGGGLANCLFCNNSTKVIAIASPGILDTNARLKVCFERANVTYFTDTENTEQGNWKLNMRVKTCDHLIGEIREIYENDLLLAFSGAKVAGWNNDTVFNLVKVPKSYCQPLDSGLNSAWSLNLEKFKQLYL